MSSTTETEERYSEAAHDRALAFHQRCWDRMRNMRRDYGAGSYEWRSARAAVIHAKRRVQREAKKPRREGGSDG